MSARSRKRAKRKAKQAQKIAWMVELRMLGHSQDDCARLKGCGNFVQSRRYYEMLLRQDPARRIRWPTDDEAARLNKTYFQHTPLA